jgi:hypothetical protein
VTGWVRRRDLDDAEWRMARSEAETVACPEPRCLARVGVTCQNFWSGEALENQPAHAKRIKAAESSSQGRTE